VVILVFLKTMASYNPTCLTPSLFTEVPVLSHEGERSGICALEVMDMCVRGHVCVG
jgi:hypothetical protein